MILFKEMKKVVCSFTFILFLGVLVLFYISQFSSELDSRLKEPVEGRENYGMTETDDPAVIIPAAIGRLERETEGNLYVAYPVGFYKEITLNREKQAQMEELLALLKEQYQKEELSYETFLQYMKEADKLIGGGSSYSDRFLISNFGAVPATYEDAKRDYDQFVSEDKITGAYARLFCDYLGIVLGIMPVFVAASLTERDRRAHMEQLVYSRKISSAGLVINRFLALVISMTAPVLLLSVHATIMICSIYEGMTVDVTAVFVMAAVWLLPEILVATAVGMVLTEVYSPLLAVFVQGIWWISSIGAAKLTGDIQKFLLIPRHNNLMKRQAFISKLDNFVFNRCFFTVMAVVLTGAAIWIYGKKRKGGFGGNDPHKKYFSRKLKASV